MSDVSTALKAKKAHGPTLDRWRGIVPLALLLLWIAKETAWFRFAVSIDKKLIEAAWPQTPLARARQLDCDPFNTFGGLWLACVEALNDVAHWRAEGSDDLLRRKIGSWLKKDDRNLWYVIQLDYSVGTGALQHILTCAIARAEAAGRTSLDRGLMQEAIDWARHVDLSLSIHTRHWGRQSPDVILKRMLKHRDWIDEAEKVGPIDEAEAGGVAPLERPAEAPAFPAELVPWARICASNSSSPEEHLRAWSAVRAYAKARQRIENVKRPSLVFTAKRWLARNEVYEPVIRDPLPIAA